MRKNGSRPKPQNPEWIAEDILRRLRADIQAGFDQLARGEGREGTISCEAFQNLGERRYG
jgi:hypothetical protein